MILKLFLKLRVTGDRQFIFEFFLPVVRSLWYAVRFVSTFKAG